MKKNLYAFILFFAAHVMLFAQQRPLITEWSANAAQQLQIRIRGTAKISYEKKDDASVAGNDVLNSDHNTIAVPMAGNYIVKFTDTHDFALYAGDFTQIAGDNQGLVDVKQWGDVNWNTDLSYMFRGSNATFTAQDIPSFGNATNFYAMFYESSVASIPGINQWDTSKVTTMSGMFMNAPHFNADLSAWNTSNVIDMNSMFLGAESFNGKISTWNTSKVNDMGGMFAFTSAFNQDLSAWDLGSVTDISGMFFQSTVFSGDVSTWNTSKVTMMTTVFRSALKFNGDVSAWDVSKVTAMTNIFTGSALSCVNYGKALRSWSMQNVKQGVTLGATAVKYGDNTKPYRQKLITEKGWNFTGDVYDANCDASLATAERAVEDIAIISPVQNKFRILSNRKKISTEVFDMNGKKVKSFYGNEAEASDLPVGVYILKISTDGGSDVKRVIKK